MNIEQLTERAMEIRMKYSRLEKKKYGREWTTAEVAQGLVGDVGDLMKLVMAKEGIRETENLDQKLRHELADCLWSLLVIARQYNIPLEEAFLDTMRGLDQRL